MLLPKPIRQIYYCTAGFSLSILCALILSRYLGNLGSVLGVVLYPVFIIIGGMPIDILDRRLRRKTRHPVWLMTKEGKQWLESDAGQTWQQEHQNEN